MSRKNRNRNRNQLAGVSTQTSSQLVKTSLHCQMDTNYLQIVTEDEDGSPIFAGPAIDATDIGYLFNKNIEQILDLADDADSRVHDDGDKTYFLRVPRESLVYKKQIYKKSVACCVYTATHEFLQRNLGKGLDTSEKNWYINSAYTHLEGLSIDKAMPTVQEMISGLGLGISRLYLSTSRFLLDTELVEAWKKALGYKPFIAGENDSWALLDQISEEDFKNPSLQAFASNYQNSDFFLYSTSISSHDISRMKNFQNSTTNYPHRAAYIEFSGDNFGHCTYAGSKGVTKAPYIAMEFDTIENILQRHPNYLKDLEGFSYDDYLKKDPGNPGGVVMTVLDYPNLPVSEGITINDMVKLLFPNYVNHTNRHSLPNSSLVTGSQNYTAYDWEMEGNPYEIDDFVKEQFMQGQLVGDVYNPHYNY